MNEDQRKKYAEAMGKLMRSMGNMIAPHLPKGMGFALMVFDLGPGGNMNWISNAQREDMIAAMIELTERLRHGSDPKMVLEALKATVKSYELDIS